MNLFQNLKRCLSLAGFVSVPSLVLVAACGSQNDSVIVLLHEYDSLRLERLLSSNSVTMSDGSVLRFDGFSYYRKRLVWLSDLLSRVKFDDKGTWTDSQPTIEKLAEALDSRAKLRIGEGQYLGMANLVTPAINKAFENLVSYATLATTSLNAYLPLEYKIVKVAPTQWKEAYFALQINVKNWDSKTFTDNAKNLQEIVNKAKSDGVWKDFLTVGFGLLAKSAAFWTISGSDDVELKRKINTYSSALSKEEIPDYSLDKQSYDRTVGKDISASDKSSIIEYWWSKKFSQLWADYTGEEKDLRFDEIKDGYLSAKIVFTIERAV